MFYEMKIRRGLLGLRDYTLRSHLLQSYKNTALKKPYTGPWMIFLIKLKRLDQPQK